ncbi:MAG: PEGA domain-containing protein [Candidatus Eremiobacteraeota bacterium]|nr:PEGA domain-containing protein [Candidatus Eremiobacteraeota bacterium]
MLLSLVFALALAAPQPFGGLYLTSLPANADVWVDGAYIGRTPVYLDGLRSGEHSVTMTKTGWKAVETDEQIAAGTTTLASLRLDAIRPAAQTGSIALHGVPRGARIRLDHGAFAEPRLVYAASSGAHRVVIKTGSGLSSRNVLVYPGEQTHVLLRGLADAHSAVVAPLSDYMPESAAQVKNGRLTVRYDKHVATGRLGDSRFVVDKRDATYDAPAGMVRGKLYLPLDLLLFLTGRKAR